MVSRPFAPPAPRPTRRADHAHPAVAHRAAALPEHAARRSRRRADRDAAAGDDPELRGGAHDDAAAGRRHRRDARRGGDRRPDAQGHRAEPRLGRRGRAAAGSGLQHADRVDRALPARGGAEERLSSLGRLSTVIAHEIRNPLMIIRASLSSLRGERVSARDVREAVADIDEETQRLNRIVTEVLDFAKPIRFELAEAELNDVCRASAAAAWAGDSPDDVRLDLDPGHAAARHRRRAAAHGAREHPDQRPARGAGRGRRRGPARRDGAAVVARRAGRRPAHVAARVTGRHLGRDRGTGISPEDMPHIFDPYFTTRRSGTGLGLPIAKNIIEGLGGTHRGDEPAWPRAPTCASTCRVRAGRRHERSPGLDSPRRRRREDPQAAGPGAARRGARGRSKRATRATRSGTSPSGSSTCSSSTT